MRGLAARCSVARAWNAPLLPAACRAAHRSRSLRSLRIPWPACLVARIQSAAWTATSAAPAQRAASSSSATYTWGWDSGRIRELADELAAEGHLVVIPKLLQPALEGGTDGDGLPPDFDLGARGADFGPWVTAVPWSKLEPQVNALLDEINGRGISKIGCMGTCWGAWTTFQTSATGRIACGVNCHPSVGLDAGGDVRRR
eukprot:COSAG02_NODE_8292_length_2629_cov_3.162055_2_plen_200_part_00